MSSPCANASLQRGHVGHVRGEAQLDLGIVGGEDDVARLGDERVADLAAESRCGSGCSGGWGRSTTAARSARRSGCSWCGRGRSRGLICCLQRVGIGRFELGQLAPVEHQARRLGTPSRGDPLELGDVGRIDARLALAPALEAHPVEQHVAQLLGAADRERGLPASRMDLVLQRARSRPRSRADSARQLVAVDLDAARAPSGRSPRPAAGRPSRRPASTRSAASRGLKPRHSRNVTSASSAAYSVAASSGTSSKPICFLPAPHDVLEAMHCGRGALGELVHAVAVEPPASRSKLITIVSSIGATSIPAAASTISRI